MPVPLDGPRLRMCRRALLPSAAGPSFRIPTASIACDDTRVIMKPERNIEISRLTAEQGVVRKPTQEMTHKNSCAQPQPEF